MRVLGIDPGSRITGLGIVEAVPATPDLRAIEYQSIRPRLPSDEDADSIPARLAQIHTAVRDIIARHRPSVVAIEQVFVAHNARSALVLGQASGSAISAAAVADCQIVQYSAMQIKRAVVGAGAAKKEQVQHMVRALLGLREQPPPDAADALACAICHIHTAQIAEKIARAQI